MCLLLFLTARINAKCLSALMLGSSKDISSLFPESRNWIQELNLSYRCSVATDTWLVLGFQGVLNCL